MIRLFRDVPIQKRRVSVILLTSGLVLAGSTIAHLVNEVLSFRTEAQKDLQSTATIIGNNSVAALLFRDKKVADESISALRKNESIIAAYLITTNHEVIAGYAAPNALPGSLPFGDLRAGG